MECLVANKLTTVVLASEYLPLDLATPPPTREMEELVAHCRNQNWELIMGCDANAHHVTWGSEDNNAIGKSLYDYITGNNLSVSNRGCTLTFINFRSSSYNTNNVAYIQFNPELACVRLCNTVVSPMDKL